MRPLETARAADAGEAVAAVAGRADAAFVAGGTTLVDLLALEVEAPALLVDIRGLALDGIAELPGGGLRVGALTTNSALAADARVRARYPVLAEAVLAGASPQIRNMATVGGNLMQRTRCPYFRDLASACNKRRPGSGCAALEGSNRTHAVLGTSELCIATHPGDMPVALVALGATVHVLGTDGDERAIGIEDFHVAYGEDPARETVLARGELITAVELPGAEWLARSRYVKARDRASYEFALAAAAIALDLDGDAIRAARVALGGVATKPWRAPEAEAVLTGAPANPQTFRAAAEAALAGARPRPGNEFKLELARRTIVKALSEAAALDAPGGGAA
jgi:xanthine dehydrogenase YagS FAD-binding subunit